MVDWSEFRAFCKDCSVGCFALLEGEALGMSEQELGVSSGVQLRSGQSFLCFFFPFLFWVEAAKVLASRDCCFEDQPVFFDQ